MDKTATPYFIIKEKLLLDNVLDFQKALEDIWPNSIFAYSVKTNSLPWILNWMNQHNIYAEVVSDEEFQLAILSGYPIDRIVFNGPIKTEKYLLSACSGSAIINIDSKNELAFFSQHQPKIKGGIGIRVNINPAIFDSNDVGYQEDGFRFGFCEENGELEKALRELQRVYTDIPIGLHLHVNSITRSVNVYKALARYGSDIINKYSLKPAYVDIGGGFFGGVPGKATPVEYIRAIKEELVKSIDPSITKLIIEPGSAAIGSAVELHTSVIDVKDTSSARIVTTDGSRIYIDPLWLKKNYMHSTDSSRAPYTRQVICGYTCMDHDRLMILKDEPELAVGDHIIYHRVGNYTVTFGGPFIRPFPPVYVEKETGRELIRRQMNMSDYYKMETV